MNQERLLQSLLEPKVSEKGTRIADLHRQYTFKVLMNATKPEIRSAVEHLFKVEVESVTTLTVPSRQRSSRGRTGVHDAWNKAYVKLKKGFEIDFMASDSG